MDTRQLEVVIQANFFFLKVKGCNTKPPLVFPSKKKEFLEGETMILNNFTKLRWNDVKIGTKHKHATHLS